MKTSLLASLLALLTSFTHLTHAAPLGTAFTYQGQLAEGGAPANGTYHLRFAMFDSASGGSPLAQAPNATTAVTNGLFTVTLDFGAGLWAGDARWLEIGVRTNGGRETPWTALAPRQLLTPTPCALYAPAAGSVPAAGLTGMLPDARLSTNVAFLNSSPTFSGIVTAQRFETTAAPGNEPSPGVTPILNMVWIKPGTFIMGSPDTELGREPGEAQRTVTLTKGFWMGHHEVTQGEYLSLMNTNPSAFTGDLNRPVERVRWVDATNFCGTLTQRELAANRLPAGWEYRLPTEAEWEYCCRALSTTRFYYGDDPNSTNLVNYAWYTANSGTTTHPGGQKLANAWGLVDMSGNVWEWCQDWYGSYSGTSVTDPTGPPNSSARVIRGGRWFDGNGASGCRSAIRRNFGPDYRDNGIGFRVVLAPGQP